MKSEITNLIISTSIQSLLFGNFSIFFRFYFNRNSIAFKTRLLKRSKNEIGLKVLRDISVKRRDIRIGRENQAGLVGENNMLVKRKQKAVNEVTNDEERDEWR